MELSKTLKEFSRQMHSTARIHTNDCGSKIPAIAWPTLAALEAQDLNALLAQLNSTQWWSIDELAERQYLQLQHVFEFAFRTIPLYREHFRSNGFSIDTRIDQSAWQQLPVITRQDIQSAGAALVSNQLYPQHGQLRTGLTTGSTGRPLAAVTTDLVWFLRNAMTIRDHLWHRRDFALMLAVIRESPSGVATPPYGHHLESWGPATENFVRTGPGEVLAAKSTTEEQAGWLEHHNPAYVLTYPSILAELANTFRGRGRPLTHLRQLRTFGEVLDSRTRELCLDVFGVPIVDNYSASEVGYIALQCDKYPHYHVMAEDLIVEVINEEGRICQPGEVGKVVLTTLHNFAMPLLRYAIGDYAEVGPPCPCGRGLPVLTRILGRQRNLIMLPNGTRHWPTIDLDPAAAAALPISQFRVIQRTVQDIEVLLVAHRTVTRDEEQGLRHHLKEWAGHDFNVTFTYVGNIPRSAGGKYEDFRCEVDIEARPSVSDTN